MIQKLKEGGLNMKALKVSLLTLFAILLAGACEKNAPVEDPASQASPKMHTYTCVSAGSDADSRILIDSQGKTQWQAGDNILFHGKYASGSHTESYTTVTLKASDISADGKKATFTMQELEGYTSEYAGTSTLYAQYPAEAVNSSVQQSNYYGYFNDTNKPLMAAYNDGDTFIFYNLCSYISFKISGDFDSYVFSGNGGETVGYSNFVTKITQAEQTIKHSSTSSPLTSVTGPVVGDGTTENYVFIPYKTDLPNGFSIKFLKGSEIVKEAKSTSALTMYNNRYVALGDITTHAKDYVAPTVHDSSIDITNAEDLSANGSANCYIVYQNVAANAEKIFKFNAVKGNSTTSVGAVYSVDVLWETYNDSNTVTKNSIIADVDFDLHGDDCYIVFQMPATLHSGNAVIAAKDVTGTILWSWHIWVPGSTVQNVSSENICGVSLMDRNLGALEPVSTSAGASVYSLGLVYQWGRKDPFPGPKRVEKDAGYSLVAGSAPSMNSAEMSMDDQIQNPTVYAAYNTSTALTQWARTKTVNDPCPPGYKLPYGNRGSYPMWNTSNIVTALTAEEMGWEVNSEGNWFKLSDGDAELVFPIAGYVEEKGSTYYSYKNTLRAAIWFLCDSGSSPYHLNIRPSESTFQFGSTSTARGCNVRCCVAE